MNAKTVGVAILALVFGMALTYARLGSLDFAQLAHLLAGQQNINDGYLLVGAAMDIYSGILVVVPLLAPLAPAFGVDALHLGAIFMVNLQLGYLMPPVGENLFLASSRFDRPMLEVFRATLPFVIIMAVVTLVVTYVPWLTVGVVELIRGG